MEMIIISGAVVIGMAIAAGFFVYALRTKVSGDEQVAPLREQIARLEVERDGLLKTSDVLRSNHAAEEAADYAAVNFH